MMHTKSALALGFVASLSAALAVDMPAGYTHLGWIESTKSTKRTGQDAYNQYIDTGYFPNVGTVIRAKFNLGTKNNNWAGVFGAYDVNDNSNNGVAFRFYNDADMNGLFCNASYGEARISGVTRGVNHEVELKAGSITIDSTTKTITTQDSKLPLKNATLYVFCEDNWNNNKRNPRRGQVLKLYSLTIEDAEGVQRQYKPCLNAKGEAGLWDFVAGVFYPNQGDEDPFNYGGVAYKLDPATGVMTVDGGALTTEDVTGVAKIVKVTDGEVEAGVVRAVDALTVSSGAFSLQDAEAATCAVNGPVTLAGGTTLKFDVTANGVDAISVTSLVLDGVTAEKPVTIVVRGLAVTSVSEETPILTGGNLTMADLALFKLEAGLPCDLTVANGNLVLAPKAADAVTWVGGTDAKWSTGANWAEGAKPGIGAPVTMTGTAGGTTQQDINGLTIASLTTVADAGSFTHNGSALAVSTKINNKSTADQTLAMPLTLGVLGKNFSTATAGNLTFSQDVRINADKADFAPAADKKVSLKTVSGTGTLAVSGPGTVELTAASPNFSGNVEVTGGTLVSGVPTAFMSDETKSITVSDGGTFAVSETEVAKNAVNYGSRKLVLSGAGVDGKGALVYNGGAQQEYAFKSVVLAGDATVGGDNGRLDVRQGTFDFAGHNLTKVGDGTFCLTYDKISTGDTPVTVAINKGTFLAEWDTNFEGSDNKVTVADGATFKFYRLSKPFEWALDLAGGSVMRTDLGFRSNNENRFVGPTVLAAGQVEMSVAGSHNIAMQGTISGEGGVKKTDAGDLFFEVGSKTYKGGTEVAGGRLYVTAKDQLPDYNTSGKVKVTGNGAGVVLSSTGWTTADFAAMLTGTTISTWLGYVGYRADEETTLTDDYALTKGSVMFDGGPSPLTVAGGLNLTDGALYAAGDVTIAGDGKRSVKRVELKDTATLLVKDGAHLAVTTENSGGDVLVGTTGSTGNPVEQRIVVENALMSLDPLPSGVPSSSFKLGTANTGVGVLDVRAGGSFSHKIQGTTTTEWSRGAIFIAEGGAVTNCCGSNGDGYVARQGYGYLQNAGTYAMRGWSQIVGQGHPRAVGVAYNTGTMVFTGTSGGDFDFARGGTGVVYQTSGTVESTGRIVFTGIHGNENACAIYTIEGSGSVAKAGTLIGPDKNNTSAIFNVREGATVDYGTFTARENQWQSVTAQPFYLNFAGGYLKPRNAGNLIKDGERYQPTRVTVFEGGMGVDVDAGKTVTLNVAVRKPEGRGIKSITLAAEVLNEEYFGAPLVRITDTQGVGYGATAVALYDANTRRVTGIKVTSPGCNYTEGNVKVEIDGGRFANNTAFDNSTIELTGEEQVAGGLLKRGAGVLIVPEANLPDGLPLTLEGGTLDLQGRTYHTSCLTLAGGRYTNGKIVADKVVSTATAFLPTGVLAENGTIDVQDGTLTVDTVGAGLMMTLVQCADEAGVDAVINGETAIDWTKALPVVDFNRANSQQGWGSNQVLAYKGYIWNRGTTDVTWTFAEHFDDGTHVLVDGVTVLKDMTYITTALGRATLTPGAHTFEVRFAQKGGSAGPAGNTYHPEWPANTLAFGLAYESTDSYDITLYDHLTDLSSGEVFTLTAEGGSTFAADGLTVEAGAGVAFNGASQTLTYGKDLVFDAADLIAGTGTMTFANATVVFKTGTTVTIADFEDLCKDDKVNTYVLVETTDGITGFQNLTFANPAPKGWKYAVKNGKKLVLQRNVGFAIIIR